MVGLVDAMVFVKNKVLQNSTESSVFCVGYWHFCQLAAVPRAFTVTPFPFQDDFVHRWWIKCHREVLTICRCRSSSPIADCLGKRIFQKSYFQNWSRCSGSHYHTAQRIEENRERVWWSGLQQPQQ